MWRAFCTVLLHLPLAPERDSLHLLICPTSQIILLILQVSSLLQRSPSRPQQSRENQQPHTGGGCPQTAFHKQPTLFKVSELYQTLFWKTTSVVCLVKLPISLLTSSILDSSQQVCLRCIKPRPICQLRVKAAYASTFPPTKATMIPDNRKKTFTFANFTNPVRLSGHIDDTSVYLL